MTWTFTNAWPVKWEVGAPDPSNPASVLTQTLEFAYTTLTSRQPGDIAGQGAN